MTTALGQAREDARFRIFNYAQELEMGEGDEQDARGLFAISWEQRQLAICRLLQDGDQPGFQRGMRRSALAFRQLIKRADNGMQVPARILLGSNWDALSAALAAADWDQARLLAARFPQPPDTDREYLDDYLSFAAMSHLVLHPEDAVGMAAITQRWEATEDGSDSDDAELWQALASGDQAAFTEHWSSLIVRRLDTMDVYRRTQGGLKTTAATEGGLFIDGLAILQLAHARGMSPDDPVPMCPRLAVMSPPTTPLSDQEWRQLE